MDNCDVIFFITKFKLSGWVELIQSLFLMLQATSAEELSLQNQNLHKYYKKYVHGS